MIGSPPSVEIVQSLLAQRCLIALESTCTQRLPIDHSSVGTCCIETTVQRVTCQLQPPTISQCAERNSVMGLLFTFLRGAEGSENHQPKVTEALFVLFDITLLLPKDKQL